MEKETIIDADLIATHFFLYKGKKFPFNMKLFKCYSQYFQENKQLFKGIQTIDLIDETEHNSDYSELLITDFIDFCQSKLAEMGQQIEQLNDKVAQQNILIKLLPLTKKSFMFSSDSDPKGVISSLDDSVTLSHGGSASSSQSVENIRQYNDKHFFNADSGTTSSESDSYIKFDFGTSKKLTFTHISSGQIMEMLLNPIRIQKHGESKVQMMILTGPASIVERTTQIYMDHTNSTILSARKIITAMKICCTDTYKRIRGVNAITMFISLFLNYTVMFLKIIDTEFAIFCANKCFDKYFY